MKQEQRTLSQIMEHYEVEKQLAEKLRNASRRERQSLYTSLYDELFRLVPHHPQLTRRLSLEASANRVAHEIQRIQPFLKRDSIFLEVGPGDCALSYEIAKLAKKVYAVDVSKEITKNLTSPSNIELVLSDGNSIPILENSIDVAYSNQLMEHLHPDDALEQLQNIYKALRPGGVYICITPNRLSGPHDVSRYFDTIATGFHLKEYTVTELYYLFRKTGFLHLKLYVRIKKIRMFIPPVMVILCEKLLNILPYSLRRPLAVSWPVAKILEIRIVGIK